MSSSVCPTPTVSSSTRSKPKASSRSATSSVVVASPPCAPRVAIERMNTPGSTPADSIRIRSPSSAPRSEEHTSELQSRLHLVCRLLLEKKKKEKSQLVEQKYEH